MSAHTPGPWSYTSEDRTPTHGSFYIRDSDGRQLYWLGASSRFNPGENHANAEFIVRACNSHDDMLEALNLCLAVIGESDMEPPVWASDDQIDEAYRKAKAALAKAKGES